MGSTPKFCHQPFATKTGKSGDTAFSGVSGIFPPHAQCCPAHDKQPDMISCHPSGAVVPFPVSQGVWFVPTLSPLAVDPRRASSQSSQSHQCGWKTGWGCSKPTLRVLHSQLPWGHVLVPMWGECNNLLFHKEPWNLVPSTALPEISLPSGFVY